MPPLEVERVSEAGLNRDVFDDGGVDRAVLQPVVLGDLFVLGFSPLEWHAEMAGLMPDRFVLSGELDPDGGQPGARGLTPRVRRFDLRGITLCERRRPAGSMRLADPWLRRTLARCGAAGADVVHIGVGPSTRAAPWARPGRRRAPDPGRPGAARGGCRRCPRGRSRCGPGRPSRCAAGRAARVAPPGFDARQFRELALALPEIRFVLGAGCLPTDELARLAVLPNVHVMLTEILPWTGSLEFAHAFGIAARAFGAGAAAVRQRLPDDAARPARAGARDLPLPGRGRPPLPAVRRRRGPRRARRQRGPALPHPARARRPPARGRAQDASPARTARPTSCTTASPRPSRDPRPALPDARKSPSLRRTASPVRPSADRARRQPSGSATSPARSPRQA